MSMVPLEAKEGRKPTGSDVWFWGQIGPDDDEDLPLAWLAEYAAKPKAKSGDAGDEA